MTQRYITHGMVNGHSKLEKGGRKNLSNKNINNLKGANKAF